MNEKKGIRKEVAITLGMIVCLSIGYLAQADATDSSGRSISTVCNNEKCNTMVCTEDQPCRTTSSTDSADLENSTSTTDQLTSYDPIFDDEPIIDEYD